MNIQAKPAKTSGWASYGFAVLVVAVATFLRVLLTPFLGPGVPFILYFPTVVVCAWFGGLGPGLLAVALSGSVAWYVFIAPAYSFKGADPTAFVQLGIFLLAGVLISGLAKRLHRATRERAVLLEREGAARVEAERVTQMLRQVQRVTEIAIGEVATDHVIRQLLARIREALATDTATILRLSEDGSHLAPMSCDGLQEAVEEESVPVPLGHGVAGQIAMSQAGMIIPDLSQVEVVSPFLRDRVKSLLGVPLRAGDRLLGVLHVGSTVPHRFTQDDLALLRLVAERVAVAIDRARLYEAGRLARAERDAAEGHLRLALEAGRMGTWEWTIGAGTIRWSAGLEAIHGLPPGGFPGTLEAFQQEIHPDDRDRVLRAIAEAVEQRGEHHVEYRIVRPDGTVRWMEGRGQLFRDPEGRPDRMVGVCADVTERKQTEERFRLAVEAAPAAMLLVDQQGRVTLANALAEQLLGHARQEIVGQPVERLVPLRFRDRHREYRAGFFAEPRRRPMGEGRELYVLRKDGTEVPVEIGLSPFETEDGTFVLAAVTDITGRKQRDEERARLLARERAARAEAEAARREAEGANRIKDDFLALLSHELRNPLNAIAGWVTTLRTRREDTAVVDRAGETIERNTRLLAKLVDDLLDVSRIVAGRLQIQPQRVAIEPLVDAVLDAMRLAAEEKRLSVHRVFESSSGVVWGDPARLHQAVANLVGNAIKFTPAGGSIEVWLKGGDSEVSVTVTDTGQGIAPDFLPHVFERFQQEDTSPTRSHGGLGLGLALVRHLVELHGGTVTAESPGRGRGARFTIRLPGMKESSSGFSASH